MSGPCPGHTLLAADVGLDRQREIVLAAFERRMTEQPEVQQCGFVCGEMDSLLAIICRDMEA